jgi:hypothetical protein
MFQVPRFHRFHGFHRFNGFHGYWHYGSTLPYRKDENGTESRVSNASNDGWRRTPRKCLATILTGTVVVGDRVLPDTRGADQQQHRGAAIIPRVEYHTRVIGRVAVDPVVIGIGRADRCRIWILQIERGIKKPTS